MNECVMCGTQIAQGILCEKCDKPRPKKSAPANRATPVAPEPQAPAPAPPPAASRPSAPAQASASAQSAIDPFPKAPIVPFPVESTSLAATSICDVLTAAKVPSLLIGPDRSVKYCSAEAHRLLSIEAGSLPSLDLVERILGVQIPDTRKPYTKELTVGLHKMVLSNVPLSGGNSGSVIILRPNDPEIAVQSSFLSYAQETIIQPLRSLREALNAAARNRKQDPLLADTASTIDQILTAFELAPGVEETDRMTPSTTPHVSDVVRRVGDRFTPVAARKNVLLQLDAQETDDTFKDHHDLEEVLVVLMENSLHYTPEGGQIVLGLRTLEHKGKPLLLFFVMDSGPLVPEELRESIFNAGFSSHPTSTERGGRGLSRCKDFAQAHGGSIWVEAKTGKACTFFLRVRPDSGK